MKTASTALCTWTEPLIPLGQIKMAHRHAVAMPTQTVSTSFFVHNSADTQQQASGFYRFILFRLKHDDSTSWVPSEIRQPGAGQQEHGQKITEGNAK